MSFIADACAAVDDTVRIDANTLPQLNLVANHHIRPDRAFFAEPRSRTNDGGGMNLH